MANELATSKDITNYLKHVFDLEKNVIPTE